MSYAREVMGIAMYAADKSEQEALVEDLGAVTWQAEHTSGAVVPEHMFSNV
jgi:hypothetical protein